MWLGFSLPLFIAALTLRPYVPPELGPEPAFVPSQVMRIQVVPQEDAWDANVFARPHYTSPLVGNVARDARLVVRGELATADRSYCGSGLYYAIEPFGWICSSDTRPTTLPVTTSSVLELVDDTSLPYRYRMVVVKQGASVPMWDAIEDLETYSSPSRELGRGDTVAVASVHEFAGKSYYITVDGKVAAVSGTAPLSRVSEFQGVVLSGDVKVPFGWVTPTQAPVYETPGGKKLEELERRTRVEILGETLLGKVRWLQIGEGRYLKADQVNEVRPLARPEGTGTHRQWIDVDLGEQVVVAYEGETPVYATLTSSGRPPNRTPRGNYPVWSKSSAITMKSQDYDNSPYYVNRVPWVMFFQAHNALHGAYWHDRFGNVKSHGCANLAPRDARYLFDWLEPELPPGWTAVRYWNLAEAPVVHVRDSKRPEPFKQERNIGPPNSDEETARTEAALRRREREERAAKAAWPAPEIQGPLLKEAPAPLLPEGPWR